MTLATLYFCRNLGNNQLSGPIPSILMGKSGLSFRYSNTLLFLIHYVLQKRYMIQLIINCMYICSIDGNPSICATGACEELTQNKSKKKKLPSFVIALVASLAGLVLIATISAAILFIFIRKKKQGMFLSYVTCFLSLHEMVIVDSERGLKSWCTSKLSPFGISVRIIRKTAYTR